MTKATTVKILTSTYRLRRRFILASTSEQSCTDTSTVGDESAAGTLPGLSMAGTGTGTGTNSED